MLLVTPIIDITTHIRTRNILISLSLMIRKAEKYFSLSQTREEEKVLLAEVYITGCADKWISSSDIRTGHQSLA
uniref:Uncharacterized protein n=1 Tax=Oryza punctata TaxID=4537 RepID=A0A0E0LTI5_ORYPU